MFGSCKPPNPINDFSTCRSVKSTPLHKSQAESGAVFEQQLNLFERAAWFDNSPVDDDYGKTSSAPPGSTTRPSTTITVRRRARRLTRKLSAAAVSARLSLKSQYYQSKDCS